MIDNSVTSKHSDTAAKSSDTVRISTCSTETARLTNVILVAKTISSLRSTSCASSSIRHSVSSANAERSTIQGCTGSSVLTTNFLGNATRPVTCRSYTHEPWLTLTQKLDRVIAQESQWNVKPVLIRIQGKLWPFFKLSKTTSFVFTKRVKTLDPRGYYR